MLPPEKEEYALDESVILTAKAFEGYTFSEWEGDVEGTESQKTITMDANKAIIAHFSPQSIDIDVVAENGTIDITPEKEEYFYNDTLQLEAIADSGYYFTEWKDTSAESENPRTVILTEDVTFTALFDSLPRFAVTYHSEDHTSGEVPVDSNTYMPGETVIIADNENELGREGYSFSSWNTVSEGTGASFAPGDTVRMPDSALTLHAQWRRLPTYTIEIHTENGSVSRIPDKQAYTRGDTVELTAEETVEGYAFKKWDQDIEGEDNPITIVVDSSMEIEAVFTRKEYTLDLITENGSILVIPEEDAYYHGDTVKFTHEADTGYWFARWDGVISDVTDTVIFVLEEDIELTATFVPRTVPAMVELSGGEYVMGTDTNFFIYLRDERPAHTISLSSFSIGKYPITQREYFAVMGENPSEVTGDTLPVTNISWYDAVRYCNALSIKEGYDPVYDTSWVADFSKNGYRLPTEAEWEYAAGTGKEKAFYWSSDSTTPVEDSASHIVDTYAVYWANSNGRPAPVGSKEPNDFGLYDMAGNVWEMCNDWYHQDYYKSSPRENPPGPSSGSSKVRRGGSFESSAMELRKGRRRFVGPTRVSSARGFRVVRPMTE
ncbi:SUMF1/EgtB/PvdO family nonheme iron enzyme [Chitinivibrio alkaliphilus]|uniref:Sulfatase-modifying factor enzyme domain-containing protein n=1 Tax=Chitinivibrio alkaliphilus ACht1 TaxID=1313304 RepID=U7D8W1_9BACT|nr:SUMF1/EgtB/PvdO family nonheme iron enzyme [Chitinivibrio alkaliphilus]ERP30830.1 hypothetical protein CALK_2318 [Chitinivibrio alkaliphilus ACht1]